MSRNISCPNFRVLAHQMAEKSRFPFFIKIPKTIFWSWRKSNFKSSVRCGDLSEGIDQGRVRKRIRRTITGWNCKMIGVRVKEYEPIRFSRFSTSNQGVNCLSSSWPAGWSVQPDTPLIGCAKVQGTIGSLTTFCSDAPPRLYIARYVADSEVLGRKHEKCDFEALRVL